MNFFSSAEIREKFLSIQERINDEEKVFKDVYWEYSEKPFRLTLKNKRKEKMLILYLDDSTQMTQIVFYFRYKLQLKKKMDYYSNTLDLGTVWKAKHYYEPLLNKMLKFFNLYKNVPRSSLEKEKYLIRRFLTQDKKKEIIENKVDTNIIKETVADNDKQITFQIFD